MTTRADRIEEILKEHGPRLRVAEITKKLEALEQTSLHQSTVSATALTDSRTREGQGIAPRFNIYGDGTETWGYLSLRQAPGLPAGSPPHVMHSPSALIEQENRAIREKLKAAIQELSWQEFESNFLLLILEALGFHRVQLTQRTRDGGVDAHCTYQRGIVASQAIVSAKHWKTQNVAADEVQRLRGIKGAADTGVIVTSSTFSEDAKAEAAPSQNQRSIVLVDGDLIVATCLGNGIGVEKVILPASFRFIGLKGAEESA